ncbi:hypothetical protein SDC9_111936 [bioreactor metagenome]|uniref:Uncharacterized protein n=1 Tax=bioreactor metagenome TaxID=1076179 RepID=A0A645BTB5_9ZZZZ
MAKELIPNPLDIRPRTLRDAGDEVHTRVGALNRRRAMPKTVPRLRRRRNPCRSAEVNVNISVLLLTRANRRSLNIVAPAENRRTLQKSRLSRGCRREPADQVGALHERREFFHIDPRKRKHRKPGLFLEVKAVSGGAGELRHHFSGTAELEISVYVEDTVGVLIHLRPFLLEPDDLRDAVLAHDRRPGEQGKEPLAADFLHNALRLFLRAPIHPGDIGIEHRAVLCHGNHALRLRGEDDSGNALRRDIVIRQHTPAGFTNRFPIVRGVLLNPSGVGIIGWIRRARCCANAAVESYQHGLVRAGADIVGKDIAFHPTASRCSWSFLYLSVPRYLQHGRIRFQSDSMRPQSPRRYPQARYRACCRRGSRCRLPYTPRPSAPLHPYGGSSSLCF